MSKQKNIAGKKGLSSRSAVNLNKPAVSVTDLEQIGASRKVSNSPTERGSDLKELCIAFDKSSLSGNRMEPLIASSELDDPPTASSELVEQPTESIDLVEPPTASTELVEPPTASSDLVEPPTASSELVEPPTASSELVEPPTASSELVEPPTASSELVEPPTASSELVEPPTASSELVEPPTASSELVEPPTASSDFPTDGASTNVYDRTSFIYTDDDSSSDSECDEPDEENEVNEIKKIISKTKRLLRKSEDAKEVLIKIKGTGGSLAKEVVDDDFVHVCRKLIKSIRIHIHEANSRMKTMNIMLELDSAPCLSRLDDNPIMQTRVPKNIWKGLTNLNNLIKHLAYTRGVIAAHEKVKDAIKRDNVVAKYENYLVKKKVFSDRILGIVDELSERWIAAENYLENSREFTPTIKTGNVSSAKTVAELQSMFTNLREMALDCDMYATSGIFNFLQIKEKLYEYVTENTMLTREMSKFLKRKMKLLGPLN